MTRAFFIVGRTATGKSEIAADIAREGGASLDPRSFAQIVKAARQG